ncbi:RagB/SusD family nutrient uptake outer membrane protein [Mucilaginibacter dorajii]|uniref:RagB/SusD family nutrient uptake outer membrane protein n=1 Tax=Mucilaginibacter dorajii TaxID=692994 RepID=A0ABP7PDY8_9SPHI|nr:RagB/SusD family nutrient uptake outer membrane protein [Mucilaginibacter dorajii]MCS3734648.1 tetratricopeptide (TPR) repeat protein [Mucilaginibacter dorajii]
MKKIRSYIKFITVFTTVAALSACNKELNLKPHDQIESDQAINTSADVQSILIGAYNRAGGSDVYGGGFFLEPDLMGSQSAITWQGTFQDLTNMVDQQITINNAFVNSMWYNAYRIINQANYVIANVSKVDAASRDNTEGQAEFLRGMTYFDLARMYGKAWNDGTPTTNLAVPLVLKPTTVIGSDSYPSRSTVAQVYQQAITDLTSAESKMGTSVSFYANSYSASAILARLYLQQGDYAKALVEANKVISGGKYSLVDNYADEFPFPNQSATHVDNTSEDIFAMQVTTQQGTNTFNTYYASADYGGRGDIIVKSSFLNNFTSGDDRLSVYNEDSDGTLRCDKFDNLYGNAHVIRLAEIYLIRAECNSRLGSSSGATPVSDINKIRNRAGLSSLATVTLTQILNERKLELAFEGGFFLHDGKRLQQTIGGEAWNSNKLVFPIPQIEINANKNLVQNPGYTN